MKKAEQVKLVAEGLETTQKDASETLDKVFDVLEDILVEHGEVHLGNLGKLVVTERGARTARNPQTGEAIEVEAKNVVKYKPSKHAKEIVK